MLGMVATTEAGKIIKNLPVSPPPIGLLIELGWDEDEVEDDGGGFAVTGGGFAVTGAPMPPTAIAPAVIEPEASQVAEDECKREDLDPNCEALLPPAITSEATIRVPTALVSREEPGIEQGAAEHKEGLAHNA